MPSQSNWREPIRVTLTRAQIVDLVADAVIDPEHSEERDRATIRRTIEALDRLGLIVREAE